MKTYSITLPDGTPATRKSPRPYTHAIYIQMTAASCAAMVDPLVAKIAKLEIDLEAARAKLATEDAATTAATCAVRERYDYLHARVPCTVAWAKPGDTVERWLSDAFRADGTDGYRAVTAATDAWHKTTAGTVETLAEQLEVDRRYLAHCTGHYATGEIINVSWSMSRVNAEKTAAADRKRWPAANVVVTDEITEKVHQARAKKSA